MVPCPTPEHDPPMTTHPAGPPPHERPPVPLMTAGRLAERLNVALHRVQYVLRTRRIAPSATAGTLRLYDGDALARVRHEINAIDARRPSRKGGRP